MTLEHVNPGEDFVPSASAWNAFTDVAKAFQAGELETLTRRLPELSSQIVIRAKNSGSDRERFQILDLNNAVFTSSDNENEYKNAGPVVQISGPPIAGREAFVGVTTGPLKANQPGDLVVAGPVVAYVRGSGKYAWPAEGDAEAFATNDIGGFPIFDRGVEVEGKRIAYLLLSARTPPSGSGAGDFPIGSESCGCNQCVEGVASDACPDCSCINKTRQTVLPRVKPAFGAQDEWSELLEIIRLRHREACIWESIEVDGPEFYSEETGTVRDKYKLEIDIAANPGDCCSRGRAKLVRTEDNGAPLIVLEWCLDTTCSTKCLCPWHFTMERYDNLLPPENCRFCVTPNSRPTACCSARYARIKVNGGTFDGVETIWDNMPETGPTCFYRAHWCSGDCESMPDDMGPPYGELLAPSPDAVRFYYFPSWGDSAIVTYVAPIEGESPTTCVETDVTYTLLPVTDPPEGREDEYPESIEITFVANLRVATSSGFPGSSCGAVDPCVTAECVREVAIVGGVKVWVNSPDSTCGDCGACGGTPCNPFADDECGNASAHDEGYQCTKPCQAELDPPETVSLTFSEYMLPCPCGASSMDLCLDEGDGHYRGSNVLCGAGHSWEYYEDGGLWYLVRDGAATASSADPAGPFLFGEVPGGDPCGSLAVTVS